MRLEFLGWLVENKILLNTKCNTLGSGEKKDRKKKEQMKDRTRKIDKGSRRSKGEIAEEDKQLEADGECS